MDKIKKYAFPAITGLVTGLLNGLFGAGGGMVAVPVLQKSGCCAKDSHATSIALILPLSVVSAGMYLLDGHLTISDALPYLPGGIAGAVVGSIFLKKLKSVWIHRIFGVLILFAAWRMFFG